MFFFQTLHAWLSVFMMQLMVFIYKCNAVFDLVRQYCVINVSGSCCEGAAVSQIETSQQGQWKRLFVLYSARDVQIYCTESLYFSLYLMSIFETNSNKHSYSVFKASLVTLCIPRRAHAHTGASVRSLLPGTRGGATKEVTNDFFRIRVERKAFPRVADE